MQSLSVAAVRYTGMMTDKFIVLTNDVAAKLHKKDEITRVEHLKSDCFSGFCENKNSGNTLLWYAKNNRRVSSCVAIRISFGECAGSQHFLGFGSKQVHCRVVGTCRNGIAVTV